MENDCGLPKCDIFLDFDMKHHFNIFITIFKIKIRNFLNTA